MWPASRSLPTPGLLFSLKHTYNMKDNLFKLKIYITYVNNT